MIVEIIGHVNDPGNDIMSIVKGYDLPVEFWRSVLNQQSVYQSRSVRQTCREEKTSVTGRWSPLMARMYDLDDAVSVVKMVKIILGVHIADVTNYVQENSALIGKR